MKGKNLLLVCRRTAAAVIAAAMCCCAAFADATHTHNAADIAGGTADNPVLWDTTVSMWNDAKQDDGTVLNRAPDERVFKTSDSPDVPFVLLDNVNASEDDGYFVFRQRSVVFSDNYDSGIYLALKFWDESKGNGEPASTNNFDYNPNDSRSIAYWLNQPEFEYTTDQANTPTNVANKAGCTIIPEEIRPYVQTHTWWQEQAPIYEGTNVVGTSDAFSVECKYNLLSITEYVANKKYISVTQSGDSKVTDDTNPWARGQVTMTRTPGRGANRRYSVINGAGNIDAKPCDTFYKAKIRPCFYLSKDFFRNVKMNVAELGDDVKQIIVRDVALDDAKNLYTVDELLAIGYSVPDPDAVARIVHQGFNDGNTKYNMTLNKSSELTGKYTLAVCAYKNISLKGADGTDKTVTQLLGAAYVPIDIKATDAGNIDYEIDCSFAAECDDVKVYLWKYPTLEKVIPESGGRILP